MAKFFVLLTALAAFAQISLAWPPYVRCGCGSNLASLGDMVSLSAAPLSLGSAVAEERVAVAGPLSLHPIERTEIVSSHISPLSGILNPSPYYSEGCGYGTRHRTIILPAASGC